MNDELIVQVATTWVAIPCSPSGVVAGTIKMNSFLNSHLCEYDYNVSLGRYMLTYSYYCYDNREKLLYLPRYILPKLSELLGDVEYDLVQVAPNASRMINLRVKNNFQPRENQPEIIDFMTNPDSGFKAVSLMTGGGKTFCAEYSITKIGRATLIVLSSLIDQWYESIRTHTNISENDLYIVRGYDTLRKLWKMHLEEKYKPKIILFAARTLYLYAVEYDGAYKTLPDYNAFQRKFGIGIKIVDECHLGFHTTVQIDLRSNIETNIYLSATYQRSNPQGKKIFNLVFPSEVKYGDQFVKRYTQVHMVRYTLGLRDSGFRTAKGYNHGFYESYLLKHGQVFTIFVHVIKYCLQKYFLDVRNEGQKCLILCHTRNFCETLARHITVAFPELRCSTYFASEKHADIDGIFSSDVIVSTTKSASTGLDIKGLKTAINTVSFASSPQASQTMGRLREIPGEVTMYVDLWNSDITAHKFHKDKRIEAYGLKALSINHTNLYG